MAGGAGGGGGGGVGGSKVHLVELAGDEAVPALEQGVAGGDDGRLVDEHVHAVLERPAQVRLVRQRLARHDQPVEPRRREGLRGAGGEGAVGADGVGHERHALGPQGPGAEEALHGGALPLHVDHERERHPAALQVREVDPLVVRAQPDDADPAEAGSGGRLRPALVLRGCVSPQARCGAQELVHPAAPPAGRHQLLNLLALGCRNQAAPFA